jgi:hypothetical protein
MRPIYLLKNENTFKVIDEFLKSGYEIYIYPEYIGNQDHITLALVHTKYDDDMQIVILEEGEYIMKQGEEDENT